jgi:hypothetical protein
MMEMSQLTAASSLKLLLACKRCGALICRRQALGDLADERIDGSGLCDDLEVTTSETPFDRWRRVLSPPESAGSYLLIERESAEQWKVPPPGDAVRIWVRRPGAASDDISNWTVWMHEAQLDDWLSVYEIAEWLPQGVQPDWS